jgi:hypothetical protein
MFFIRIMAPKNLNHSSKVQGTQDAEWVAEMPAFGGTGASAGRRNTIVRSQMRAYGIEGEIDGKNGTGVEEWIDCFEYLIQMMNQLILHQAKFPHYKKSVLTLTILYNSWPPTTI